MYEMLKEIKKIVLEFAEKFTKAKLEKNIIDLTTLNI